MKPNEDSQKGGSSTSRADKLKQIEQIYHTQMKQIYNSSKEFPKEKQIEQKQSRMISPPSHSIKRLSSQSHVNLNYLKDDEGSRTSRISKRQQMDTKLSKMGILDKRNQEQKVRASTFLQGESVRTIEILRKENENKEIKIRELTNLCENLIEKLKIYLDPNQMNEQMENMKEFSDRKMQRLENLFKIKNQQIFFKMKLQIISLLQEFQVSRDEIDGINQVNSESALFSFMVRKLKLKLKDFRSKQQQSNFQIQKDKIMNQKYEERIQYLMETNELLKLSQSKQKNKIQDLRGQLHQYLEMMKAKQEQNEEKQNQIFRLKKQSEELIAINQKLVHNERALNGEKAEQKINFESKQKQMKNLLSSYFMERKKLQAELEEKEGEIEELLIKEKFLQRETERINREFVRWKERYEWLEKEKQNREREFQEQKMEILNQFQEYKNTNNQGVYIDCKTETDAAIRKTQELQFAYQKVIIQKEELKKIMEQKIEILNNEYDEAEKQWRDKSKKMEKMKEDEMLELSADHENRQAELRDEYEKRQQLLKSEMNVRMKATLAENDKKSTEFIISLEAENDDLRREVDELQAELQSLTKTLEVQQTLTAALNLRKQQNL